MLVMDRATKQRIDNLKAIVTRRHWESVNTVVDSDTQVERTSVSGGYNFTKPWSYRRKARAELRKLRQNFSDREERRYITGILRRGTGGEIMRVAKPVGLVATCIVAVPVVGVGCPLLYIGGCIGILELLTG